MRLLCLILSLSPTADIIVDGNDQLAVVIEVGFEVFVDVVRQSVATTKGEGRKAELVERVVVPLTFRPTNSLHVGPSSA